MTNKDQNKVIPDTSKLAALAVEEIDREGSLPEEVTLSTGVVVKFKQIPPGTMIKVLSKIKRPEVPQYYVETEKRWFSNPDDEQYIKDMEYYELESAGFLLNTMILKGLEIVEVPKGLGGPNSNGWLEDYEALGDETLPDNKSWRKLNWILDIAAATDEDFEVITKGVGGRSGVPEENVAEAAKFPRREKDGGDSGGA